MRPTPVRRPPAGRSPARGGGTGNRDGGRVPEHIIAGETSLPEDAFGLSPREREVLHMLALGKSNPEIAEDLFIGRGTVRTHVSNILAARRQHAHRSRDDRSGSRFLRKSAPSRLCHLAEAQAPVGCKICHPTSARCQMCRPARAGIIDACPLTRSPARARGRR